ncbi:MAG: hypothetical protein ACM3W7_01670 [Acidobacteriota bacterium]
MGKLGIAALAGVALLAASTAASAQVCTLGTIIAAIYTNATEHRELTLKEAATCGLIHDAQAEQPKKAAHKKKIARRVKKKR